MQQIIDLLEANMLYVLLALISMSIIFLILIIILFVKNRKLNNRYKKFMCDPDTNIEELLIKSIEKSNDIEETYKYVRNTMEGMQVQLKNCIQKVGVVRYNAISGVGSDLCFAVALLDEEDTGVVINGIYTRDGSYTYGKEVVLGKSKHRLSDEEIQAIEKAKQI